MVSDLVRQGKFTSLLDVSHSTYIVLVDGSYAGQEIIEIYLRVIFLSFLYDRINLIIFEVKLLDNSRLFLYKPIFISFEVIFGLFIYENLMVFVDYYGFVRLFIRVQ